MNKQEMLSALRHVADGSLSPEDMLAKLKQAPFEDIGCARIDHHRAVRQGAGEVIYGASKTPEQILKICRAMISAGEATVGSNSPAIRPSQITRTRLLIFKTSGSSEEIMMIAPPSSTILFIKT